MYPFDSTGSVALMEDQPPDGNTPVEPGPGAIARRKVLFGLGFGAANLALLRHLTIRPAGLSTTPAPAPSSVPATTSTTSPPATTTPTVPPVLDDSLEVATDDHVHDTVIAGGRVIDPDSGFDAVAHLGIDGDTITQISLEPLSGSSSIDATGLVVSPGFIDILSYPPNGFGEWFKVADGVTTNLNLHGIDDPMTIFLDKAAGNDPPVNYGGAADQYEHRKDMKLGISRVSGDDLDELVGRAETDVLAGALGIHEQPEYTVDVSFDEMLRHGEVAARYSVPLCLHVRYSENLTPGTQEEALDEAIRVATQTGCRLHIEHINSTGGTGRMAEAISQLDAARASGIPITACTYPYTFWATNAASARYDNFREKYGISWGDLQIAGTDERLTEETFNAARREHKVTAAFAMSDDDIDTSLLTPWVMIGSDAILERPRNNHPRSTGCFSRVLGHYVRERGLLTLPDALAKMTILPARMLGDISSAMARRGRIQPGAVADITVFDPTTIIDRSTIADPAREAEGVRHVLVSGRVVRTDGVNNQDVRPGVPILRDLT